MRPRFFLPGLLALLAAAVFALPAGAAAPTTGKAGLAYVQLQTTRDALQNGASAFTDPYVASYVQQSILSLNSALTPTRWNSGGLSTVGGAGAASLGDLREAAAWLVWGDAGLRDATVTDQRNIVWSMGQVVRARFDDVFHFVGEGGGASPWALWASEYMLNTGDAEPDIMLASLDYQSAWQYLAGQPPCCA